MKRKHILCLFGMLFSILVSVDSMSKTVTEEQLKTVYIYNFVRFVQWPENKSEIVKFQLCTYPRNRFGETLLQLEKRKIKDKAIEIKEILLISDIQHCHAVFIDEVAETELEAVLAIAKKNHILTISDQLQFAEKGGMMALFVEAEKIRFNINYYTSQQAILEIDSKLISLASHIIREEM